MDGDERTAAGTRGETDEALQDEAPFRAFGQLLRETFGTPVAALPENRCAVVLPTETALRFAAVMENIMEGQRFRGFRLPADGKLFYKSKCVGYKRIAPLKIFRAKEITKEITASAGTPSLRDFAVL